MIFPNPIPDYLSDHNHDQIEIAIFFAIFWAALYILVNYMIGGENTGKNLDTKNRVISIVHGLLSLALASFDTFIHKSHLNDRSTNFQNNILLCSLGYFLYDVIACVYYGLFDMDLLIHHTMASAGLITSPIVGYGATCSIRGILCSEVSNFPMHCRSILKNYGLRHTRAYEYLERIYFFLYAVSRGLYGPWLLVSSIRAPNNPLMCTLVCALLEIQSFIFIFKMFKIIKIKFQQRDERK